MKKSIILTSLFEMRLSTLYAILLVTMLYMSSLTRSSILSYATLIISVLGIANPIILVPSVFTSSLSSDFFSIGGNLGFYKPMVCLLIIALLIAVANKNNLRSSWNIITEWDLPIVLVVVSFAFSFAFAILSTTTMLIDFTLPVLLLFLVVRFNMDTRERKELVITLYYTSVISLLLLTVSCCINPTNIGSRVSLAGMNPNRLSIMAIQTFAMAFASALVLKRRLALVLVLPVSLMIVLMSGSRTGLVTFVAVMIIAYFALVKKPSKRRGFRALVLLIGLAAIFFSVLQIVGKSAIFSERFDYSQVIEDGGTGRLDRIVVALQYIVPDNWLIGVGPYQNEQIALSRYFGDLSWSSSHNIIISMLTGLGVLGVAAYLLLIVKLFRRIASSFVQDSNVLIPLLLLAAALVNGVGEIIYYEPFFFIEIAIALMFLPNCSQCALHRSGAAQ